ncbi:hypothetical protein EAG_06586 [Camponotus floridanus]|uniref:Uncharacterized protein n=1 Tax=Camponotus floridanus TaxID=104421 RepID=E2A028_CAMFO|nr:hypothetical protein EAG_06586 [Camponotus floridanus]
MEIDSTLFRGIINSSFQLGINSTLVLFLPALSSTIHIPFCYANSPLSFLLCLLGKPGTIHVGSLSEMINLRTMSEVFARLRTYGSTFIEARGSGLTLMIGSACETFRRSDKDFASSGEIVETEGINERLAPNWRNLLLSNRILAYRARCIALFDEGVGEKEMGGDVVTVPSLFVKKPLFESILYPLTNFFGYLMTAAEVNIKKEYSLIPWLEEVFRAEDRKRAIWQLPRETIAAGINLKKKNFGFWNSMEYTRKAELCSLKLRRVRGSASLTYQNSWAFNKKQLTFHILRQPVRVLATGARPNCSHELYPLCSNFKSNGGSLKRQLPRNPRSRTFEGGFKPGYPLRALGSTKMRTGRDLDVQQHSYNVFSHTTTQRCTTTRRSSNSLLSNDAALPSETSKFLFPGRNVEQNTSCQMEDPHARHPHRKPASRRLRLHVECQPNEEEQEIGGAKEDLGEQHRSR